MAGFSFTPLLAHGTLGVFDEIIFIAVAAAFVVIMGISYLRSRSAPADEAAPTPAVQAVVEDRDTPDRYTLD